MTRVRQAVCEGGEAIDADVARLGVHQLLAHFRRLGISQIPAADADAAAQWAQCWSEHASDDTNAATRPEDTTVAAVTDASSNIKQAIRPKASDSPATSATFAGTPAPAGAYASASLPLVERQAMLDKIRGQVEQCAKCQELARTRTQTVFGRGNVEARVCFFGEAPGSYEDQQGQPFVGRAGELLDKIILASKLSQEDVYILNTLKCRPPDNRNPLPEELTFCRPFYESQLEIIQPEYIVCLGLFAMQSLLESSMPIGKMRGRFHQYRGSKVLVTYHPAYLLRNEKMKAATWQDMQMLMRDMGTLV